MRNDCDNVRQPENYAGATELNDSCTGWRGKGGWIMRMKVHKIISTVLVVAMLLGNEVFAASRRETVWVGRDQAWHYRPNIARGRTSNSLHARASPRPVVPCRLL